MVGFRLFMLAKMYQSHTAYHNSRRSFWRGFGIKDANCDPTDLTKSTRPTTRNEDVPSIEEEKRPRHACERHSAHHIYPLLRIWTYLLPPTNMSQRHGQPRLLTHRLRGLSPGRMMHLDLQLHRYCTLLLRLTLSESENLRD